MCQLCGMSPERFDAILASVGGGSASATPMAATSAQVLALVDDPVSGRWNSPAPLGTPVVLTYSFLTAIPVYENAADYPGFQAFNATQQIAARNALNAWSAISGISFIEVPATVASDISFAGLNIDASPQAGASGFAYLPWMSPTDGRRTSWGGDSWYDTDLMNSGLASGWGYHVLLHEIGHAIGLKHPFSGSVVLPAGEDNTANTVMSYSGPAQSSPRPFDIAAAQYLYGATQLSFFWDQPNLTLTIYGFGTAENLIGSIVNDIITAGAGADNVIGLGGNDWLYGGDGSDIIRGGDGNDVMYGDLFSWELGSDNLSGDAGNDILIGGALLDILEGGADDDWLFGSDGNDILRGGDGNDVAYGDLFASELGLDVIEGGAGADTLIGGEGDDAVFGASQATPNLFGDGADWLYGSSGNDTLNGGEGADVLYGDLLAGETGADSLIGGAGNDLLWGGPGNDRIDGGTGTDTLFGNEGTDTFLFGAGSVNRDVIWDFSAGTGGDVIDLRGFTGGSTYPVFFANFVHQRGANTVLDFDGAGTTLEITLMGVTRANLTASNFILA